MCGDMTAVQVMYGAQNMGDACTVCNTSDADGRLSYNDLKDLLFRVYVTLTRQRPASHRIPLEFVANSICSTSVTLSRHRMLVHIFNK
jgi:hypothetical protein